LEKDPRLLPEGHIDSKDCYKEENLELVRKSAKECGIHLFEGVYAMSSGPTFETPAEAKLLERLGAGALGMSTVPEIMTATALGLNTIGISMITNLASFLSPCELADEDVRDASLKAIPTMRALLLNTISKIEPNRALQDKILARFNPLQKVPALLPLTPVPKNYLLFIDQVPYADTRRSNKGIQQNSRMCQRTPSSGKRPDSVQ